MSAAPHPLLQVHARLQRLAQRDQQARIHWMDWLPWQSRFIGLTRKVKLVRTGNQLGKTYAALGDFILRCLGAHPTCPTAPPLVAWIVTESRQQGAAIQAKFVELCPPDQIDWERSRPYTEAVGFGFNEQFCYLRNGTLVSFRTYGQGSRRLEGASVDLILLDEPPTQSVYRTAVKRVRQQAGTVLISMTPQWKDCSWLKKLVEKGVVEEVHAKMTPENLRFVGSGRSMTLADGTPMDEAWIAQQRAEANPIYAPVELDGEWEYRVDGAYFRTFGPKNLASAQARLSGVGRRMLLLGLDYAAADREQGLCSVLSEVLELPRRSAAARPRYEVLALDEVVLPGSATHEQLALGIKAMLTRNGLDWKDLAAVHGDNPAQSLTGRKVGNSSMASALAEVLDLAGAKSLTPPIKNAKEGGNNKHVFDFSLRWVYEAVTEGRLWVRRDRCPCLWAAFEQWDYDPKHPGKDVLDAFRYSLKPVIFPYGTARTAISSGGG